MESMIGKTNWKFSARILIVVSIALSLIAFSAFARRVTVGRGSFLAAKIAAEADAKRLRREAKKAEQEAGYREIIATACYSVADQPRMGMSALLRRARRCEQRAIRLRENAERLRAKAQQRQSEYWDNWTQEIGEGVLSAGPGTDHPIITPN
jgi:hypothetical protein